MAGSPPPPDAPSPAERANTVDAGFVAGPPAANLCGFKVPTLRFKLGFNIPSGLGTFPPPLPRLTASLGINCDTANPINISAGIAFGGGRKPTGPSDPDDDETS